MTEMPQETQQTPPQADAPSEEQIIRSKYGMVRSISGKNTINVTVDNLVKHKMYGKYIRKRTRLAVHDDEGIANVGDRVQIVPCRRLSKTKSWRLVRVVRTATQA
jgi:small subunit ribosomal protein S17